MKCQNFTNNSINNNGRIFAEFLPLISFPPTSRKYKLYSLRDCNIILFHFQDDNKYTELRIVKKKCIIFIVLRMVTTKSIEFNEILGHRFSLFEFRSLCTLSTKSNTIVSDAPCFFFFFFLLQLLRVNSVSFSRYCLLEFRLVLSSSPEHRTAFA